MLRQCTWQVPSQLMTTAEAVAEAAIEATAEAAAEAAAGITPLNRCSTALLGLPQASALMQHPSKGLQLTAPGHSGTAPLLLGKAPEPPK